MASRSKEEIAIVLNPTSGRGKGATLSKRLSGFTVFETQSPGHATQLAQQAIERGFKVVASAGGDGTLNEVMRGVLGSESALGVIPVGTGNDFSRHLGVGTDIEGALEVLLNGSLRTVDTGTLNGVPFLNVVSCGFDAVVGMRINQGYRWARGTVAYLLAVLQTLADYRPAPLKITVDGEVYCLDAMLCAIANASSYGGGMKIAPHAALEDGQLDVVVLESLGKLEFLRQFPKVFKGTHVSHPAVRCFRGSSVRVESERRLPVLNDGDLQGHTPIEAVVVAGSLTVVAPD